LALNSTGKIRALISDLGGTTIDYGSQGPAYPFIEVFKRHGVLVTAEETRMSMGVSKRQHFNEIGNLDTVARRWQEVHGQPFDSDNIGADRVFEEFMELQRTVVIDTCDLIPGFLDVVETCRERNIKLGSTTGYSLELAEICVAEMKKRGFSPGSLVSSSDVPKGRPEPYMCLESMINLEVWPGAACVNVDDSIFGVTCGVNAGMWSIGIAVTGNEFGMTEN